MTQLDVVIFLPVLVTIKETLLNPHFKFVFCSHFSSNSPLIML